MVSVLLYLCILFVVQLVYLFFLCVACLTVFVNCLVKQFAICFGVIAILVLNVMAVLLLFAMIRSVVKSFKVPDVDVVAARMSNESALTRMTDSTQKPLSCLTLVLDG